MVTLLQKKLVLSYFKVDSALASGESHPMGQGTVGGGPGMVNQADLAVRPLGDEDQSILSLVALLGSSGDQGIDVFRLSSQIPKKMNLMDSRVDKNSASVQMTILSPPGWPVGSLLVQLD